MIETKELNKVEKYLLRMISRFMDSEKIHTENSIEAIVVEALRRYYETIDNQINQVFSINGKTGKVILTSKDLNAEQKILKKSAFNSDFGNQEGTVTSGVDERLSDSRDPLTHVHELKDLEELHAPVIKKQDRHKHINIQTLEKIRYEGDTSVLDMIFLENILSYLNNKINIISLESDEVSTILREKKKSMTDELIKIQKKIQEIYDDTMTEMSNMNIDVEKAITDKKVDYINNQLKYVAKELVVKMQSSINNSFLNGELINIPSESCSIATGLGEAIVNSENGVDDLYVTFWAEYTYELPEEYDNKNINIFLRTKYEDDNGKIHVSSGPNILTPTDNFYGTMESQKRNGKNIIVIKLFQSKMLYGVSSERILTNKKLFSIIHTEETWENAMANTEDSSGRTMASVKNQQENELLSIFDNAWISARFYGDKWVWYKDLLPEENEELAYSNWDINEPINEFGVYHENGWITLDDSEIRKTIVEWEFKMPHELYKINFELMIREVT